MFRSTILACSISLIFASAGQCQDETKEPPIEYQLLVNGKALNVELDTEFELDIQGKTKLKLTASNVRNFKYGGITFPYPTSFAFEAELDAVSKLWTLDGSSCLIMVFAFPSANGLGHKSFAESIGAEYQNEPDFSPTTLTCDGQELEGTQLNIKIEQTNLVQMVFEIPTKDGARVIVLQDTLEDDGSHTAEFNGVVKLLKQNLKISQDSIATDY